MTRTRVQWAEPLAQKWFELRGNPLFRKKATGIDYVSEAGENVEVKSSILRQSQFDEMVNLFREGGAVQLCVVGRDRKILLFELKEISRVPLRDANVRQFRLKINKGKLLYLTRDITETLGRSVRAISHGDCVVFTPSTTSYEEVKRSLMRLRTHLTVRRGKP